MPSPRAELASLDFGNLIGSPLVAVITAQSIAARATADFIKAAGFDADDKPIYVDFKYPKEANPYQPAIPAVSAKAAIGNPAYPNGMQGTSIIYSTPFNLNRKALLFLKITISNPNFLKFAGR